MSVKYDIDVAHVRRIQGKIIDSITSTFSFRKGYGSPVPVLGHYAGIFKCGEEQLVIHTDGVGSKVLVAQALGKYDSIGIDAIAMNVNDILCVGAEPLVGVDYIALSREDDELVSELIKGLVKGAEESNCAIIGGETAILPDIVAGGPRPFDINFTIVGRVKQLILGNEIAKGDVIVGLESSGLHSNGYTLARKVLDIQEWGKEMLKPTRIYSSAVLEMIDACDIHGIAHITGGSFSKLNRLNNTMGYVLTDLPKPTPIFRELQKHVEEPEVLYRTFNMGVGMAIILPEDRAGTVINIAKKHDVEAWVIGRTTEKKGIWIKSNGNEVDISIPQ